MLKQAYVTYPGVLLPGYSNSLAYPGEDTATGVPWPGEYTRDMPLFPVT